MMKINKELAKKRNLSEDTVKRIEEVYEEMDYLISSSKKLTSNKPLIGVKMEDCEYLLQELWGFERNANFHTHYMKLHGCTCPKMDNKDDLGYRRTISGDCPYHFKIEKELK